jgi:hypothetical protein
MSLPQRPSLDISWGSRPTDVVELTNQIWDMLQRLKRISPLFNLRWTDLDSDAVMSDSRAEMEQVIANRFETENRISLYTEIPRPADELDWSITISARVGRVRLWDIANAVSFNFKVGGWPRQPFPVNELLPFGVDLVKSMVDVWEPDSVDFSSGELVRAHKGWKVIPGPSVGFVSWWSDRIIRGDLSILSGVTVERYNSGFLVGTDLESPTLLEDGLALVRQVINADLLLPLPDQATTE